MKVSSRADVAPFYAMEVLKAANAKAVRGDKVLHLEVGEPGRGAPAGVIAAAHRALDAGGIGYTEAFGETAARHPGFGGQCVDTPGIRRAFVDCLECPGDLRILEGRSRALGRVSVGLVPQSNSLTKPSVWASVSE